MVVVVWWGRFAHYYGSSSIRSGKNGLRSPRSPFLPIAIPTQGFASFVVISPMGKVNYRSQLCARWIALFFICFFMACVYYSLDNPAALHDQLRDHFSHLSTREYEYNFNLLYTAYSMPNVILPFFGGIFVDRYGAEICCLVFLCFTFLGQVMVAYGVFSKSFTIMIIGRVVFGIGGESICVASSALLQKWFEFGEVALAMGLCLSVSRMGSVANNIVSPWLTQHFHSLNFAFFFSCFLIFVSLIASSVVIYIGRRADHFILNGASATAKENNSVKDGAASEEDESVLSKNCKKIRSFPFRFWLMCVSCVVVYGTVLPFNNVASALIIEKFICRGPCCGPHMKQCHQAVSAEAKASYIMGIPFTISALLTPVVGGVVDYCGGHALITTTAAVILFGVHVTIRMSNKIPYVPLIFQGIAYSMYASALWPAIGAIVPLADNGVAYGFTTAVQNIGLAALPMLVAYLRSNFGSYNSVEVLFIGLSTVGIAVGIIWSVLAMSDRTRGGVGDGEDFEKESLLNDHDVVTSVGPGGKIQA